MSNFELIMSSVVIPIVISYGVLWIDQRWHGKNEYSRAFARSVSLGVNCKKHPDKITLEALFVASEAELQYACGLINKDFKEALNDVDYRIKLELDPNFWNYNV